MRSETAGAGEQDWQQQERRKVYAGTVKALLACFQVPVPINKRSQQAPCSSATHVDDSEGW